MRSVQLVVSVLVFSGCRDDAKEFEAIAQQACECAEGDAACGEKVLAAVVKFADDHGTKHSDQARINEAGVKLTNCLLETGVKPTALTAALERM
jgi:hypothetical protein